MLAHLSRIVTRIKKESILRHPNDTQHKIHSIMMLIKHQKLKEEVVFHSDEGVQYSSIAFMSTLK